MPTGGKLVGAIAFAALAYFITDLVKPLLPEGTQVGLFSPINAFFGLIMGWKIMGRGAGGTYRSAFGYGLTTLFATAFWCVLFWAFWKMLGRSMDNFFDGPVQALQGMAEFALEYIRLIAVREVIWPAIIGALFMAWLTEFFARRWS